LDIGLLSSVYPNGAELIVTHNLGGGTERAILEHAQVIADQGICPLVLRTDQRDPSGFRVVLRHALDSVGDNLGDYDLRTDTDSLAHILTQFRVRTASVQHLIDFNWFAPDLLLDFFIDQSITYDVVLHDFFLVCPRVNMTDGTGRYCGGVNVTTCQSCVINFASRAGDSPAIVPWHQRARRIISGATAVYAPSLDTLERFEQLELGARIQYRPHSTRETALSPDGRRTISLDSGTSLNNRARKILIVGAISVEKGARLLLDVARLAETTDELLHFHILGYTCVDAELALLNNVTIHGAYEEDELQVLIHEMEPDLVWFPGMWPETFSYTVNSVIESRICPVLSFDIGAIGHRIVSEGLGWTVPLRNGLDTAATLRDVTFYSSPIRHRAWVASANQLHDTSDAVT
jgi:glycosyltransferase involved in cell wall biosynthesis